MKRFLILPALLCALLWLVGGCSAVEDEFDEMEPFDPDPGYEDPVIEEPVIEEPVIEEPIIEASVFLGCDVVSDTEIDFKFSAPVTVLSLTFEPDLEIGLIEGGGTVKVYLENRFRPGTRFTADILAEDEWGNIVSAQTVFEREAPPLAFVACTVISGTEIQYTFSAAVTVTSLSFNPVLEIDSIEDGSTVKVFLENGFRQGIRYEADMSAKDEWGYEISVLIPFETEAPPLVFLACAAVSQTRIDFEFSIPVQVISLSFDPPLEIESVEEGGAVSVHLGENLKPGQRLTAEITAEDEFGRMISAPAALIIKNDRIPVLRINELRTEFVRPRSEFIEFKMMTAGNLGSLQVFIAGNYKSPLVYEFQPVEVAEGEYVVLHLRTLEDVCTDEYGDNLDESAGTDSSPTARDLWIPGSTKMLHKTDAVYVTDQEGRVLDAVMISETPDPWWAKDYFAEAAEFLFSQGAWKSPSGEVCGPAEAVNTSEINTSGTRSVSRVESADNTNTRADWYVTPQGGATPGLPNSR